VKFNSNQSPDLLDTLSIEVRFYPTVAQQQQIAVEFGAARAVWNWGRKLCKNQLLIDGKTVSFVKLSRLITLMKKDDDFKWLNNASDRVIKNSLKDLETAYTNHYRNPDEVGKPKFKEKTHCDSVRYQDVKIVDGKITIPKLNALSRSTKQKIKVKWSKYLPNDAHVLSITCRKTSSGEYYLAINYRCPKQPTLEPVASVIGLDVGIKTYVTASNDTIFPEKPKRTKQANKKAARLDRKHSKCKKGSNRKEVARKRRAKAHRKQKNIRKDFIHKLTNKIVRENQIICVEDLNVEGLKRDKKLATHISDCAWGEFFRQLEYKSLKYGRTVVKINRFFPSSKNCSTPSCHYKKTDLKLSDRIWTCPDCGHTHDRDKNAAINILNEGLRILIPGGTGKFTDVDMISYRNSDIPVVVDESSISVHHCQQQHDVAAA
jgi:putative transposase